MSSNPNAARFLTERPFRRLRGDPETAAAHASVIIPVNAQTDLQTALIPLADLASYSGKNSFEVILLINNYAPDRPPAVKHFEAAGIQTVCVPDVRRAGEVVIMSARAWGVKAARGSLTIHFDADCRLCNVNSLLDWYIEQHRGGASVAYSSVGYYDLRKKPSVYFKIALHHLSRWVKRNVLGIPTTRGSNYAIDRELFLTLYEAGQLSVDLQVGPAARLAGAAVVYGGRKELKVLTSGRRLRGGWLKMIGYFYARLRYNLHAIPTRRRSVTRASWEGFDEETERRRHM